MAKRVKPTFDQQLAAIAHYLLAERCTGCGVESIGVVGGECHACMTKRLDAMKAWREANPPSPEEVEAQITRLFQHAVRLARAHDIDGYRLGWLLGEAAVAELAAADDT